jgi:diacylglycerol kinase (ATP)
MRALLVHNANAGTDPVSRTEIEEVLRSSGIESDYCAHGDDDLSAALYGSFDLVVAAGGDGTIADVVSELQETGTPIGILPLGGSNNIANALDVDLDWRTIPSQWSLTHWMRLDRCEANGPWGRKRFVEAVGVGVLTDAVDDAQDNPETPEEKQANGRAAFRKALADAEPFNCEVETGDWSWQGDCLMVEVMNIPFVGSHLALAKGSVPDDGLLDIVLVTPDQRTSLLSWAENPDASPCPITPQRASAVRLTACERRFRVDDRCPNEQLSGTVEIVVRQNSVRVLTPEEAQR